jgi:hypothetical protein
MAGAVKKSAGRNITMLFIGSNQALLAGSGNGSKGFVKRKVY